MHDDDAYEAWDDDRDLPQERDLVDDDDDQTPTVDCPSCGREIAEFADRCPYCGDWVVAGGDTSTAASRRLWPIVVVIILIAGLLWVYTL